MTPQQLAEMLADAIDEDWCDADDRQCKAVRFTPSIVSTRHFLGVKTSEGQEFFITIEEAK